MSTIVVVKKNKEAVIGADTLFSQGSLSIHSKYVSKSDKIIKLGDSYFGTIGSSATNMVLLSLYNNHKGLFKLDGAENIFETLLRIHPILKDDYYIETTEDSSDGQEFESNQIFALIANKSGLYDIQSYREVQTIEKFWAIGSGRRFALGAMHAMYEKTKDPKEIAKAGLNAACEFDDASGLPIQIKSIVLD